MARRQEVQLMIGGPENGLHLGEEKRWLLGPAEGAWWVKFSWFVIPLGLILLILPWILYFNKSGGAREGPTVTIKHVTSPSPSDNGSVYEYVIDLPE